MRCAVQGLGNDFIIIDNRSSPQPVLTPEQVRIARACAAPAAVGAVQRSPNNWRWRRL